MTQTPRLEIANRTKNGHAVGTDYVLVSANGMIVERFTTRYEAVWSYIVERLHELGHLMVTGDSDYLTRKALQHADPLAWFEQTPLVLGYLAQTKGGR